MESNLLTLAKQYQKEHKWDKAIECYRQYMNNNVDNCTDAVYTSYSKCLRVAGQMPRAKEMLMKGNELYPQSEKILNEFFALYDVLGDWNAARSIANSLIEVNPEKADYYFKLGRSYASLRETKKAEQVYETGLTYLHGLSFNSLIEKIQKGFTDHPGDVTSEYLFINGKNNFGAMIHQYGNKKYFTKITKYNRDAQRERNFYKDILSRFPVLQEIVPMYIDSQVIDQVLYLTIEMIDAIPKTKYLDKVIDVSQHISTVKYQDLVEDFPNPDYLFQLKSRGVSICVFFTQIHKKYYNQKLVADLHMLTQQKGYSAKAAQIIHRLETLIMDNRLYAFIRPEKHYTLLHGDFITQNVKIKKDSGVPQVYDWAGVKIGPHFVDIARYLTASSVPYSDVKGIYLLNEKAGGKLSLIEKVFFLYAYILMRFVQPQNIQLDRNIAEFILPALEDMEAFISQFKRDEFGFIVQSLLEEKDAEKRKNYKMKQRISNLEKERKRLQVKLKNTLNSKSWKMTAPLRRFTERGKKAKHKS